MASLTIAIPEPLSEWVESRLADGGYATADDYLRDLIDRDRADWLERDVLSEALEAGERSGISERRVTDILAHLRETRSLDADGAPTG